MTAETRPTHAPVLDDGDSRCSFVLDPATGEECWLREEEHADPEDVQIGRDLERAEILAILRGHARNGFDLGAALRAVEARS